jgi:hypothetical protein
MTESEFERGHIAGGIAERLASHDKHFETINGSLADVAREMGKMTLAVQRLGDQADSAAKTVITTAQALEKAEAARRSKSESAWSPFQKILVVISVAVSVIGLFLLFNR